MPQRLTAEAFLWALGMGPACLGKDSQPAAYASSYVDTRRVDVLLVDNERATEPPSLSKSRPAWQNGSKRKGAFQSRSCFGQAATGGRPHLYSWPVSCGLKGSGIAKDPAGRIDHGSIRLHTVTANGAEFQT